MRAGACAVQQTLSSEAASVLKHSLGLARRRGHAQVTPLHVAATLLSSRVSLLRRACLKSQPHQPSHPLQCRALELCFNVALNRLPASPAPLLHGQPSLSNALIAALKRAQAHQRRGCIEQQQQQPLIAIKVELEQLILSILDDPSVSRVMREAGFSSTAVKNNLEDSSVSSVFQCYNTSGGIYSTPNSPPAAENLVNPSGFWHSNFLSYTSEQNQLFFSPQKKVLSSYLVSETPISSSLNEDIKMVLEVFMSKKRRNIVIVGDSVSMTEGLVSELTGKMERGEVPEELKSAHFIKFQFSTVPLRFMKREEVEMNVADLRRKVESFASGGGVVIYTGDLKWTVDTAGDERETGFCSGKEPSSCYSPVDHLVAEIGKLVSWYNSSSAKVWLMATASYQTYRRCQMKQPPVDVQWSLHAVSVPSGGLGLSLNATSNKDSRLSTLQVLDRKPVYGKEEQDTLTCCPECISNYDKEASQLKSSNYCGNKEPENGSANLPYWLKQHGNDAPAHDNLLELKRKWNRLCQNLHQAKHHQKSNNAFNTNQYNLGRNYYYPSAYPCWSNQSSHFAESKSISFADPSPKPNENVTSFPQFRRQQSCHIEFSFSNGHSRYQTLEPNLDSLKTLDEKEAKITLALGNSMISDAVLPSEKISLEADMLDTLKENVPWQSETIPSIVSALMDHREINSDTWLLIEGNDSIAKRRLAIGVAKAMFGSSNLFLCLNMRKNSTAMNENTERIKKALRDNDKLVVLVEDVDCADGEFLKFLGDGLETGKFEVPGQRKELSHVIFILATADPLGHNEGRGSLDSVIEMKLIVNESAPSPGMPNLEHKRKEEWDSSNRRKCQRKNEMKHVSAQVSSNTLDLNMKSDENDDSEEKTGEFSPISSDLTREITVGEQNSLPFLEKIKNRFVFSRYSNQDEQVREIYSSKIRKFFLEAYGSRSLVCFIVEDAVLDEVFRGSGLFLNSLFDQWLKDVFQTSLRTVNTGGKDKTNIRLCLGGKGESCARDGFMGTCLPKRIQVSFIG